MTPLDEEIVKRYLGGAFQKVIARELKHAQSYIRKRLLVNDVQLRDFRNERGRGGRLARKDTEPRMISGRLKMAKINADSRIGEWRSKAGKLGGPIAGQRTVQSGRILKMTLQAAHTRPTWPEVRFYGLVLGDLITAQGFTAQQSDGHGIYDGAWVDQKIIAELDGGGHHVFRDRHADDTKKDIARMLDYNTVLREEDENTIFLKALAILSE